MPTPFLLAFGFANAPLLYGLAAASVPFIIHLLNRRKFREVRWAAMRFLMAAVKKNSRRIKVEQWLLLAIRTLIVIFIVSAMAKPFLESLGAIPVLAGQRTHRVLVIDGSMSMGYSEAEKTRFDQAKAVASRLVKDARRGDSVSMILMADPPKVIIGDPSPNQDEVLKVIDDLRQTHGGTNLVATFEAIDRVLEVSTIPQKEVIFLTDLQTTSWRNADGGDDAALKRVVARVEGRRPRSVVIDLGKVGSDNRAVTELKVTTPIVTVGAPTLTRAVLHNYGASKVDGLRAKLIIDGTLGPEQTIDLPAGEDVPIVFNTAFETPGDHLVEVQLDDDPLKLDDRRWLALPVREKIAVLLVDGDFKSTAFQAETDYLAQALSPESTTQGPPSAIRTDVIPEGQLAQQELAPYEAVVLCNIAQFTATEVSALEDYLKQGGGVVVFGGDQVVPENYNRLLYEDGKGLLPALVSESVGDSSKKESGFGFNPLGYRHPIVELFAGESEKVMSGLTSAKTWQFHKLKLPADSQAKVALAFDNGDPAVIETLRGRGRVIQVATSADAGWSTWPLHPSYPPIMTEIILQAASGKLAERNLQVGKAIDQVVPTLAEATATMTLPDSTILPAKLGSSGTLGLVHFEQTDLSGPYSLKIGPPVASESLFALSPPTLESDLTKLDKAGLTAAVPNWSFAYLTNWKELTGDAAAVSRRGEFHRPLLYGLLVFLLLESLLAWRFGHHANQG